jgi:hypothetical protein
MFLKDPARIEGLLCCHFIALLVQALIERQIRTAMVTNGAPAIPLYPEERDWTAPSASPVLEICTGLARHHLVRDDKILQVFQPSLDPLQGQVLDLLGIAHSAYVR